MHLMKSSVKMYELALNRLFHFSFLNKGFLTIQISEEINYFRNLSELESKISKLVIEEILITLFKADKIEEYLIQ